jgi:hypothetical protein
MTGQFQVDMVPSFCNAWPEIEIEINGKVCWHNFVEYAQTVTLHFDLAPVNHAFIRYLNKQNGPDIYDTVVDIDGKIIQDQKCKLDNFMINRSRCDFLKHSLEYHHDDGRIESNLYGFLSYRGYYQLEFPENVYQWINENRKKYVFDRKKSTSSLDYWTNYVGDPTDPQTQELLHEVNKLLLQIKNDKNIGN